MGAAQSDPFTLWNYLDARRDLESAAAWHTLFRPDFVEVGDHVLLAEQYDPAMFEQWQSQFNGQRRLVEAMINHGHLVDLFNNNPASYGPELSAHLGRVLMTCRRAALHASFPHRSFSVEYADDLDDYGSAITFFQIN